MSCIFCTWFWFASCSERRWSSLSLFYAASQQMGSAGRWGRLIPAGSSVTEGALGMVVLGLKQSWRHSLPAGLPWCSWVMPVFLCPLRVWGGLSAYSVTCRTDWHPKGWLGYKMKSLYVSPQVKELEHSFLGCSGCSNFADKCFIMLFKILSGDRETFLQV